MRKVFLTVLAISTVLFISACSSKEEQEVLDFHNDLVDEVYPIYEEFIDISDGLSMTASDEEVYELFESDLIPMAEEIEQFFDDHDPESEVAREYYDLRNEEYQYMVDFIYESKTMLGDYINGTISEEEFDEKAAEVSVYMDKHYEAYEVAEDRWAEIFDEYGFKEIKE